MMIHFFYSMLNNEGMKPNREKKVMDTQTKVLFLKVRFLIVIVLMFSGQIGKATADFSLSGIYRHYPQSGGVDLSAGYSFLLWGKPANTIFYGYLRYALDLFTAGTYNEALVSVDLFPVSFLGVSLGQGLYHNSKDYEDFDCLRYKCIGEFNYTFVKYTLILGYKKFFFYQSYKKKPIQAQEVDKDHIIPDIGLAANSESENISQYHSIVGWSISSKWTMGYQYIFSQTVKNPGLSQSHFLLVSYKKSKLTLSVSLGSFYSSLKPLGFSTIGYFKYQFAPSLSIF
ncbi:MAG: hypothetical protein D6797_04610 [Bdellovibrio sp.]|nr:MAG: hypothetical protein D6797_04610 [Bdellovibrio sp.]